jgi:hypothetical protein
VPPVRSGHYGIALAAKPRLNRVDGQEGVAAHLTGLPMAGYDPIASVATAPSGCFDHLQPSEVEHLILDDQRSPSGRR